MTYKDIGITRGAPNVDLSHRTIHILVVVYKEEVGVVVPRFLRHFDQLVRWPSKDSAHRVAGG